MMQPPLSSTGNRNCSVRGVARREREIGGTEKGVRDFSVSTCLNWVSLREWKIENELPTHIDSFHLLTLYIVGLLIRINMVIS